MRTIGFFNSKGGVGTTSLVYHIAWMLATLGARVIAADLDPQADLTSMFLEEEEIEQLWEGAPELTVFGAVAPEFRGTGDIMPPTIREIDDNIGLLVGDMQLAGLEDALSDAWARCANGEERSFHVLGAFARSIATAGRLFDADVTLIDVGPNLGAVNRTVLRGCDFVVVPLGADLFSLQGLRNSGPALRNWRNAWQASRQTNADASILPPGGEMRPGGYVVMRHSVLAGRPARAFGRWMARIPAAYHRYVLDEAAAGPEDVESDPHCLAVLKDYRSLVPLAQEARKPMFMLRPADGAFGGHQRAVQASGDDFERLARRIMTACGLAL